MAFFVPVILGGLALAVMAVVAMLANRQKSHVGAMPNMVSQTRILIHAINDDRCTGCDACVAVCPTNVLDLISNKSRVLRFQDCIQCEACMWACPTEALVMFPEGQQPPPVKAPEIDANYETVVRGQYLIGEVAGKPLVKNAANLGRAVVEHMLKSGLQPSQGTDSQVDVLIVGSGPGGMSAALTCIQRGLSYVVIEKENVISSTVSRYPKGKSVMAEPYDTANLSFLPVVDSSKEEMVALWKKLSQQVGMKIKMHETVETVVKQADGSFLTETTGGKYTSAKVVLATGTRGKPRTLGVPGEQQSKVESLLEDPDEHRGKAVCVIGGGDSALEAAMALAESGAKVILSYRGRSFRRAQAKNRQKIDEMDKSGELKVQLQSEVAEFGEDTVTLQMADGTQKRYPNQAAFVLIGADPPIRWLATLGVHYIQRPHMQPMPASDAYVQSVAAGAQECSVDAEGAAAVVLGRARTQAPQPVHMRKAPQPSQQPYEIASAEPLTNRAANVGRRFVRSATSLFGKKDENRAIPLSEFAQRASTERPRKQQRDELNAGERTRILRMLRDEGGRYADEDSKVLLDDPGDFAPRPKFVQSSPQSPPKQAVIVGLAKAATDPRRQRRAVAPRPQSRRQAPAEPQQYRQQAPVPTPEYQEEPTNFMHFQSEQNSVPVPPPVLEEQEERTRNMDLQTFLAERGMEPVAPQHLPPDDEFEYEEKTRVAIDYEPRSLSEVDWDLD